MSPTDKLHFSPSDLPSKVGDVVCWKGIAAHFFCGQTGLVLELRPNKEGVPLLDECVVLSTAGHVGIYYLAELAVVGSDPTLVRTNKGVFSRDKLI
jgi:hypothetical protein